MKANKETLEERRKLKDCTFHERCRVGM